MPRPGGELRSNWLNGQNRSTHRNPRTSPSGISRSTISVLYVHIIVLCITYLIFLTPVVTGNVFKSLRIHPHYDETSLNLLSEENKLLLKRTVSLLTDSFQQILKINRTRENLLVPACNWRTACDTSKLSCGGFQIPDDLYKRWNSSGSLMTSIQNYDFLLFVKVVRDSTCNDAMKKWSYMTGCTASYRPTSGMITYCPDNIDKMHLPAVIASTTRDLIKLLGFQKYIIFQLFPNRTCPLLKQNTLSCATSTDIRKGASLLMATPKVRDFIRNHTGSTLLEGIPMSENQNGWTSQMMFTSILADSPITTNLAKFLCLDKATLSVLADSGWYQVIRAPDKLLWGHGFSENITINSCEAGCRMGLCNLTNVNEKECFQLGPVHHRCTVCQNLNGLRTYGTTSCLVGSCSNENNVFTLQCINGTSKRCVEHSHDPMCIKSKDFCNEHTYQGFVTSMTILYKRRWPEPTTTPAATTSMPRSKYSTKSSPTEISPAKPSYRFSFVFKALEYSIILRNNFQDNVKQQITTLVLRILNLQNPNEVLVTKLAQGSTVVHFTVYGNQYPVSIVFQKLKEAVYDDQVYIIWNGRKYFASVFYSYDYSAEEDKMTEIIVGTTLGALLIIGVICIIIILIIKKLNHSGTSVSPINDNRRPSSALDSMCRTSSMQTVSIASCAQPYEHRLDSTVRSANSVRAASLRNVSVTDLAIRRGISQSDEDTSV